MSVRQTRAALSTRVDAAGPSRISAQAHENLDRLRKRFKTGFGPRLAG